METTQHMPLTIADRCDQCSAQAMVRMLSRLSSVLDFCAHHHHINQAQLSEQGFSVHEDARKVLLRK